MNSANPFQIPTCFQNVDEQRKRERFKKGVIAVIAAVVLLLVGLLIQGCKSERASTTSSVPQPAAAPVVQNAAKPVAPTTSSAGVMPQPVSNVPKASMTPAINHSETVYVVKSGDTLSRIAKAHGISLKALRSANGLDSDHIAVGTKLKIPTA